jgi:amino-acid N-acetyltransferase
VTDPIELRPAEGEELAYAETLLSANDLPTADLRDGSGRFYVARTPEGRVGVGGIEVYGPAALLRSVAVEDAARGEGHGTAICDGLASLARAEGVETLYLLTTTAAEFFAARGYREIDRADAPARIRETTEFAELCPSSAVCMERELE